MDDPFAALVEEMNLNSGGEQKESPPIIANGVNGPKNIDKKEDVKLENELDSKAEPEPEPEIETETGPKKEEELRPEPDPDPEREPQPIAKQEITREPEAAPPLELEQESQPQQETESEDEEEEEADDGDDDDEENALMESIANITSISELRDKFMLFYKEKEKEIYELKNKFTDISRRQKEVFIEVENRRKTAVSKGKKYKQTAQKLHYQINKLNNDLKFERKKNGELNDEISIIRDQKKQREEAIETLTNNINLLKSNLNETEQSKDLILDSYQQTHNVIDKLIQNEKVQEKLKCFIQVESNQNGQMEAKSNENDTTANLSVLKLQFLDSSIDPKSISIQWNRSYFTELISIKKANGATYKVSADDIGSIIKVEVRSKDNPECYQNAVLKNGPIKMHKLCTKTVQENLLKINKQQIEFEIEPDLSDSSTQKLFSNLKQKPKQMNMILLFNKDKIKLRTQKNVTVDKEQYNDSMKITLSAISNRFSFKLSAQKKYVFLAKTALERDNIAILLRSYIERLRRNTNNILCELYLRISNERRNNEILNKSKGLSENTLTRDQLVSKILAPISSNPRISPQSFTMGNSVSSNMFSSLTAPTTNPVVRNEPSFTNEAEDVDIDVDQLFPDFNNDQKPQSQPQPKKNKSKKSKQKKNENTANQKQNENENGNEDVNEDANEIQFDADEPDLEAQNQHKKAWKKLEFAEDATIASEQELKQNAIVPAPTSRAGKGKKKLKKKTKTKTKAKSKKKAAQKKVDKVDKVEKKNVDSDLVKVIAEISDRVDILMTGDGKIIKHQIVGNLNFKYDEVIRETDKFFIGDILNLEHTKTKIFNPLTTEELDGKNGTIRVKLVKDSSEKNIAVLKYVWNINEIDKCLPFLVELEKESSPPDIYTVSCIIKPNENAKASGKIKELSITGQLKNGAQECIENTEADNIQFIWSQSVPNKFMWSLKMSKVDKAYALTSKFKCDSNNDNKVQLKIQFEIEDIGLSTIEINAHHNNKENSVDITKITKCIRSGEFVVR